MLETLTRLNSAIRAFLKASSKLESLSLCLPTPLVTKAFVGVNYPLLLSLHSSYIYGVNLSNGGKYSDIIP